VRQIETHLECGGKERSDAAPLLATLLVSLESAQLRHEHGRNKSGGASLGLLAAALQNVRLRV